MEIYQRIEAAIGKKLEEWSHEKDQVMALKERVEEAKRIALQEIKVNENRIHGFPAMAERAWGLITYF